MGPRTDADFAFLQNFQSHFKDEGFGRNIRLEVEEDFHLRDGRLWGDVIKYDYFKYATALKDSSEEEPSAEDLRKNIFSASGKKVDEDVLDESSKEFNPMLISLIQRFILLQNQLKKTKLPLDYEISNLTDLAINNATDRVAWLRVVLKLEEKQKLIQANDDKAHPEEMAFKASLAEVVDDSKFPKNLFDATQAVTTLTCCIRSYKGLTPDNKSTCLTFLNNILVHPTFQTDLSNPIYPLLSRISECVFELFPKKTSETDHILTVIGTKGPRQLTQNEEKCQRLIDEIKPGVIDKIAQERINALSTQFLQLKTTAADDSKVTTLHDELNTLKQQENSPEMEAVKRQINRLKTVFNAEEKIKGIVDAIERVGLTDRRKVFNDPGVLAALSKPRWRLIDPFVNAIKKLFRVDTEIASVKNILEAKKNIGKDLNPTGGVDLPVAASTHGQRRSGDPEKAGVELTTSNKPKQ
ncbi:MAG: hypothetical protein NTW94_00905 [Legionellales bacterium]|nr:hypothetical protein [Legionellales bacterium]